MKKRGRGMAVMFYPIGATADPNPGTAFIKVNPDGTATVYTGAAEIGQGSNTVLAQIAGEELGISFDKITMVTGDTKLTPYDIGAVASRLTYINGRAVKQAAAQAKQILLEVAAEALQVNIESLNMASGEIYIQERPERKLTIAEVACKGYFEKGRPPIGAASFNPDTTALDPNTGQGKPYGTYVFAAQIAEVEVDTQTGEVQVLRVAAAHDCGRAINPLMVASQVEGGVAMGIGYALMEEMILADSAVWNTNLHSYLLPTVCDVPQIAVEIVEDLEPTGPFGAKGIGEPALLPTAPAVINAIYDAVGIKIRDLPATPEKILRAINELTDEEG